jgi:hypothetical protein
VVAKGYTSVELVADEVGDALTDELVPHCNTLIAQAEAYIDRFTGRAWLVSSPITDELHTVVGPYLYLRSAPVTAITAFKVRVGAVGAPDITLVAGSQYELINPTNGIVLVNATYPFGYDVVVNTTEYAGYIAKISYTAATPVPGDIERAATLLVAQWLTSRLNTDMRGVKSYAVGSSGDTLNLTFQDANVPTDVMQILQGRRRMVLV